MPITDDPPAACPSCHHRSHPPGRCLYRVQKFGDRCGCSGPKPTEDAA